MSALLPCPFCGEKASHNTGGNSVYGRFWWAVWCEPCQVELRDFEVWKKDSSGMLDPAYPPQECFARWNTRATLTDPATITLDRAKYEALVKVLAKTRGIVCEAAVVGFNWETGDWAARLYENNGDISAALRAVQS